MEKNRANYGASTAGFLAEIDRMQLEIKKSLSLAALVGLSCGIAVPPNGCVLAARRSEAEASLLDARFRPS